MLLVGVVLSVVGGVADPWPFGVVPFGVALTLLIVWWRVRYLHVEFGPDGAAFGFTGPRRRVLREQIQSARVEDYSAVRYMGWGYRIGWKTGDRAYSVIGQRRGVRLEFTDERGSWSVFVACSDPDEAIRALGLKA